MTVVRQTIEDFATENAYYAGAGVSIYEVDVNLAKTATLAPVYAGPTGPALLANPQTLDSKGRWPAPVYVDRPVIMTITRGSEVHDTGVIGPLMRWRGDWATGTTYFIGDRFRVPSAIGVAVVTQNHVSSAYATDLAAGRVEVEAQISVTVGASAVPVLVATSAAGTYGTAYDATSTVAIAEGSDFIVILDKTAEASATLRVNGGTARSLRDSNGAVLPRGAARGGRAYVAKFYGGVIRLPHIDSITYLNNRISASRADGFDIDWKADDADALHRARVRMAAAGVDVVAGGDGTNAPTTVARAQADGDVRVYNRLLTGTPPYEPHTDANPPAVIDAVAAALMQVPVVHGRDNRDVQVVDFTTPYLVSTEDWIRVAGGVAAFLNFSTLQVNRAVQIEVQSGCTATFWAEINWRGTATQQLAAAAGTSYRITRSQTEIYAELIPAHTTASGVAAPTYTAKVGFMPAQSWGVMAEQDVWGGFQAEMRRIGLPVALWVVQGLAAGASSLQRTNDLDPWSNNWWNNSAGSAGPLLTAANGVMTNPATRGPIPPAMTALIAWLGLNDAKLTATNIGMDDTGDTTPATWVSSFSSVAASARTALSNATLPFIMCPLPNQPPGTFYPNSITAVRIAQINAVATLSNVFRGPESYDLWRYGDKRHLTYVSEREFGRRLARFYAAAIHGWTGNLGPKIIGFSRISARQHRVTILRGPGGIPGSIALRRPLRPAGFGILPPGTALVSGTQAARYEIVKYAWSTSGINDVLDLYTATDTDGTGGGPRLVYPDGFMDEARDQRRVIAGEEADGFMPLLTHRPGDYVT